MSSQLIKDLLFNTALLLSISIVYNLFLIHLDSRKKWLEAVLGLFLGGVGILLMINTVSFANGIIFDTRSILISVTGLFLGYLPTVIAALLVSLYRLYLGGGGALTGVLVTATSAAIGLLWHRYRLPKIVKKSAQVWPELYLFGLLVHLVMLADMLTLPNAQGPAVLQAIILPVLMAICMKMPSRRMEANCPIVAEVRPSGTASEPAGARTSPAHAYHPR